ncbi:MAG: hypothetical protein M1389_08520 [Chloroflexi bacterium]|nr:hypothetical protein [Chloroflexota bacterium]
MDFEERLEAHDTVIAQARESLWNEQPLAKYTRHVPFGYETYIDEMTRRALRRVYTPTGTYIRYAPDYVVLDLRLHQSLYMLEYKTYQRPLRPYGSHIDEIREKANDPSLTPEDISMWEESAYDHYKALEESGVRVAVLNWVPHNKHRVVCDFVEKYRLLRRGKPAAAGRTRYANVGIKSARSLSQFLCEEHNLTEVEVDPLVDSLIKSLLPRLPVIKS